MSPEHIQEWIHLLLRWTHVLAGIMWIGDSFLFMWLDRTLAPPVPAKEGVAGELYMVHGGGYYQVEKRFFQPGKMPPVLHWFMWEARTTWLSGIVLLLAVYYAGGAALLVDPTSAPFSVPVSMAIGLGSLPLAWIVYDALWQSPLGKSTPVAGAISVVLLAALSYGLTQVLSPRAAFLHVGAVLGTLMFVNVQERILPAQRRMLASVKAGEPVDPAPGLNAKKRSTHNTYMTLPVLLTMVSNHFPMTYGTEASWLVLVLLALAGASVRHVMLVRTKKMLGLAGAAVALLATAFVMTGPERAGTGDEGDASASAASAAPKVAIDAATVGEIRGVVRFEGAPPERSSVSMASDCAPLHKEHGPVLSESVVVADGLLANVLVSISKGAETWEVPAPEGEVVVDQKGCVYHPHVLGARVNQTIAIKNSDPVLHNVHAVAKANDGFNFSMPVQGGRNEKRFARPEVVTMKCDVHPWMGARIGVFAHPWFAVTDAKGAYTLAGVPPGKYTLTAWHETLGEKTAEVEVPASGSVEAAFAFAGR